MAADHPPCCSSRVRTTASDLLWHAADQKGPTIYNDIPEDDAGVRLRPTRCAAPRPQPSASATRCASPTSPQNGVDDLVALLKAADVPGPYVLVRALFQRHDFARVFAGEHPDEVTGIVFVDVLTPELRAQMTTEEWKIWKAHQRPAGQGPRGLPGSGTAGFR